MFSVVTPAVLPKISESPLMGGVFVPVQLDAVDQLADPLPVVHVSVAVKADGGVTKVANRHRPSHRAIR